MISGMHAQLRAAAFGDRPMPEMADLAHACAAGDQRARLLVAILFGAGGRYAPAATILTDLAHCPDPALASLAATTLASHRRQLGGHGAARIHDARALRLVAPDPAHAHGQDQDPDGLDLAGARADALIGLTADAVGLGDLAAAGRLLTAARATTFGWRERVRLEWVCTEHALACGDSATAIEHGRGAVRAATERGAHRHIAKSRLVLAAGLAATGTVAGRAEALDLGKHALETVRAAGWSSLIWPAAILMADLDTASADSHRAEVTHELYEALRYADPQLRRLARASGWVPL